MEEKNVCRRSIVIVPGVWITRLLPTLCLCFLASPVSLSGRFPSENRFSRKHVASFFPFLLVSFFLFSNSLSSYFSSSFSLPLFSFLISTANLYSDYLPRSDSDDFFSCLFCFIHTHVCLSRGRKKSGRGQGAAAVF